jgi:SAM-dependent methyltransferase
MTELAYRGEELEFFARAHNWKAYFAAEIRPFLRGAVLEVGAGLGATTRALADCPARSWLCLEPDPQLAARLTRELASDYERYTVLAGSIDDVPRSAMFDAILYVDVLEHIERDADELVRASQRLSALGHLVVLSPAHAFLMSDFDRAIGHYRRYDANGLVALTPPELELLHLRYLDSCGMLASLANRWLLRQGLPTHAQIAFWDRRIVPVSRRIDPWLAHRLGKSILAVWRRA